MCFVFCIIDNTKLLRDISFPYFWTLLCSFRIKYKRYFYISVISPSSYYCILNIYWKFKSIYSCPVFYNCPLSKSNSKNNNSSLSFIYHMFLIRKLFRKYIWAIAKAKIMKKPYGKSILRATI